ncbi:MAG: AbrB/MazE/SpoVT family DNA-binding domain-containing protein [Cytophagales bacterium]|nr:AbrB/MazE/SpoVT family DNA-binding domain-containing protein [Cytophagales bacterium]
METYLRPIGNSRGVIIPASMLRDCNIEHEIRLIQDGARLVIEAVRKPRQGWFDKGNAQLRLNEPAALGAMADRSDAQLDEEWDW